MIDFNAARLFQPGFMNGGAQAQGSQGSEGAVGAVGAVTP